MAVERAIGMDFLDLFSFFPANVPRSSSRRRSRQEDAAGTIGLFVFPVFDFFIVLFAELYKHPIVAGVVLPAAFASTSLVLCRLLRVPTGWTIAVSLGCLGLCLAASMAGMLLGVFASFYSGF